MEHKMVDDMETLGYRDAGLLRQRVKGLPSLNKQGT